MQRNDPPTTVTTEMIWRELSDQLRQFIRSRIASTADADDILQNVFLRIHRKLDDLSQVKKLQPWVFTITRNAITDHYRKRRDVQQDFDSLPSASDEQSENHNSQIAQCIGSLINHLPADQQRAVSMYELEGIPQKEIAIREEISVSGAKSRVQRGRKTLEAMLRDCCLFEFDQRGNVLEWEAVGDQNCGGGNCGCDSVL